MNVRALIHPPEKAVAEALTEFERQFEYPLGPNDTFSISHGPEYLPFFMAMGAATLLFAEHQGHVVGTMVLIRRQLEIGVSGTTDERSETRTCEAHYICDLKISPAARSTSAFAHLMKAAADIVRPFESHACYSVVMAGTSSLPDLYTGRLGIPRFEAVDEIAIVRFVSAASDDASRVMDAAPDQHKSISERLPLEGIQAVSKDPTLRSIISIQRFGHKDGTAVAILEDTRKGKRLTQNGGGELLSSHLSGLRWSIPQAASDVIRYAFQRSLALGFPAMFCAVPWNVWKQLEPTLDGLKYQLTSAMVYGYAVPEGLDWWIDTSEI
ncbi:MAG: hypothetical protein U0936_09900 [Planctomycetaceae bacterium]